MGLLKTITTPERSFFTYTYNDRGDVTSLTRLPVYNSGTQPATLGTTATYPSSCSNQKTCNEPTSTTDEEGNVTSYTYDPDSGAVATITGPADSSGIHPQKRIGYGTVYAWYKNASGALVQGPGMTMPTSISQCRTQASCSGSADEQLTTIAYPTSGAGNAQPSSTTVKAGDGSIVETTGLTYNNLGEVLTVDGPLAGSGDTTRFEYDEFGQPMGRIEPSPGVAGLADKAIKYSYDAWGHIYVASLGTVADQSDAAWNNFAEAYHVFRAYDSYGRVERQNVWSNGVDYSVTDFVYDALGRPYCTIAYMNPANWGPQATSCAPLQTNGPNGPDRVTMKTYDALGRVTQVTSGVGTSEVATDSTSYTANGEVASVEDADNNLTTYSYDGYDRLVKTSFPDGTQGSGTSSATDYEQYDYDANGNLTSLRLRDGTTVTASYDALDRITSKVLPNSEGTVTYAYDLFGDPLSISGGTTLTNVYDALGRMTYEGQPFGAMSYQYDAANRLIKETWQDGFYVNYDYLPTGEVSQIRENGATSGAGVLATYGYDSLGNLTTLTRGDGTVTSYTYDAISRLASLSQDLGGTAYDTSSSFSYNPASQITSRARSNDAYAWNGAVNVNRSYSSNGLNQYTVAGPASFTYDARGNLAGDGTSTYGYDSQNLLRSKSGGITMSYDPIGRMVDYDTAVPLRFMYAGDHISAEIDNPTGAILRRYVYGPGDDAPIVWYEGSDTSDRRFLHADERGSIVAVTDSSGGVLGINTYDEYGIPGAANIGRFQYTGQAWFSELGIYDYKARMYSATLGRFMQTDPIGYGDGLNMYRYAHNDPVNGSDPTGLWLDCTPGEHQVCITGQRSSCTGGSFFGSFDSAFTICEGLGAGVAVNQVLDRPVYQTPPTTGGDVSGKRTQPQKDTSTDHCLWVTTKKHAAAVAVDGATLALTFAAPEAKLVALAGEGGAKLAEVGLAGGGLALAGAGATHNPSGVINGVVGYHFMMADWASLKGGAGAAFKALGRLSGVTALALDAADAYDTYKDCRKGE